MQPINGQKVFQLNEIEWWAAPSLEECTAAYLETTGVTPGEAFDEFMHELTDEEMDTDIYLHDDGRRTTFRVALQEFSDPQRGVVFPNFFAGIE